METETVYFRKPGDSFKIELRQWIKPENRVAGQEPETLVVEAKETELPRDGFSVSGYGAKIPTRQMVRIRGKWRRVYIANYGNAGTAYIGKPGAWEYTVI